MATLDVQDARDAVSDLAGSAADAVASVRDTLTSNVLPAVVQASGTFADAASSAASSVAEKASDLASTASDKAQGVDKQQLKRWWPIAAVVALFVAVGFVHRRKKDDTAESSPGED
jgi:hypothetical protein